MSYSKRSFFSVSLIFIIFFLSLSFVSAGVLFSDVFAQPATPSILPPGRIELACPPDPDDDFIVSLTQVTSEGNCSFQPPSAAPRCNSARVTTSTGVRQPIWPPFGGMKYCSATDCAPDPSHLYKHPVSDRRLPLYCTPAGRCHAKPADMETSEYLRTFGCFDNCPDVYNPDQADADGDGFGNACDRDADGDEVFDKGTIPPDTDRDNSSRCGLSRFASPCTKTSGTSCCYDNCPLFPNAYQIDTDSNGVGDVCELCFVSSRITVDRTVSFDCSLVGSVRTRGDADGDEIKDIYDNAPAFANPLQCDRDYDDRGDERCYIPPISPIQIPSADGSQSRLEWMGSSFSSLYDILIPNACALPTYSTPTDNCPVNTNYHQLDTDGDGIGDNCDNCIDRANEDQSDSDHDGWGDDCDLCSDSATDYFNGERCVERPEVPACQAGFVFDIEKGSCVCVSSPCQFTCSLNTDCASGRTCSGGYCAIPSTTDGGGSGADTDAVGDTCPACMVVGIGGVCTRTPQPDGTPCLGGSCSRSVCVPERCPAGTVFNGMTCVVPPACTDDAGCRSPCATGSCVGEYCSYTPKCLASQTCSSGVCSDRCSPLSLTPYWSGAECRDKHCTLQPCVGGYVCNSTSGDCEWCSKNGQCPTGTVCGIGDRVCRACAVDAECGSGNMCSMGSCMAACAPGENFYPPGGCTNRVRGAKISFGTSPAELGEWTGNVLESSVLGEYASTIFGVARTVLPPSADNLVTASSGDAVGNAKVSVTGSPAAVELALSRDELYFDARGVEEDLARTVRACAFVKDAGGRPMSRRAADVSFSIEETPIAGIPEEPQPGIYCKAVRIGDGFWSSSRGVQINANVSDLIRSRALDLITDAPVSLANWDVLLDLPKRTMYRGQSFVIPVKVKTDATHGVYSFAFTINYDANAFEFVSAEKISPDGDYLADIRSANSNGVLTITSAKAAGRTASTGTLNLIKLNFRVKDSADALNADAFSGSADQLYYEEGAVAVNAGGRLFLISSRGSDGKVVVENEKLHGLFAYLFDSNWVDYRQINSSLTAPSSAIRAFSVGSKEGNLIDVSNLASSVQGATSIAISYTDPNYDNVLSASVPVNVIVVLLSDVNFYANMPPAFPITPSSLITLRSMTGGGFEPVKIWATYTLADGTIFDVTDKMSCAARRVSATVEPIVHRGCVVEPRSAGTLKVTAASKIFNLNVDGAAPPVSIEGNPNVALAGSVKVKSVDGTAWSSRAELIEVPPGNVSVIAEVENIYRAPMIKTPIMVTAAFPAYSETQPAHVVDVTEIMGGGLFALRGDGVSAPTLEFARGATGTYFKAVRPGISYIDASFGGRTGTAAAIVDLAGATFDIQPQGGTCGAVSGYRYCKLMNSSNWATAIQNFGSTVDFRAFVTIAGQQTDVTSATSFAVHADGDAAFVIELDAANRGRILVRSGVTAGVNHVRATYGSFTSEYLVYVTTINELAVRLYEDFDPISLMAGFGGEAVEDGEIVPGADPDEDPPSFISKLELINGLAPQRGRIKILGHWWDGLGNDSGWVNLHQWTNSAGGSAVSLTPSDGLQRKSDHFLFAPSRSGLDIQFIASAGGGALTSTKSVIVGVETVGVNAIKLLPSSGFDPADVTEGGESFDGTISGIRGEAAPVNVGILMSDGTRFVAALGAEQYVVGEDGTKLISFGRSDRRFTNQPAGSESVADGADANGIVLNGNGAATITLNAGRAADTQNYAVNLLPAVGDMDLGVQIDASGKDTGRFIPVLHSGETADVDVVVNTGAQSLKGYQLEIYYNSNVIGIASDNDIALLLPGGDKLARRVEGISGSDPDKTGKLVITGISNPPAAAGHVKVATVRFAARKSSANLTHVTGRVVALSDASSQIIPAGGTNNRAMIAGDGYVDPDPIPAASGGSSCVSGTAHGDITDDDAFNIDDVIKVADYTLGTVTLDDVEKNAASYSHRRFSDPTAPVDSVDIGKGLEIIAGLNYFVEWAADIRRDGTADVYFSLYDGDKNCVREGDVSDGLVRFVLNSGALVPQFENGRFVVRFAGMADGQTLPISGTIEVYDRDATAPAAQTAVNFGTVTFVNRFCDEGLHWDGNSCVSESCVTSASCASGTCNTATGDCGACVNDAQCSGDEHCLGSVCRICPAGQLWSGSACETSRCSGAEPCDAGYNCGADGVCRDECVSTEECGLHRVCTAVSPHVCIAETGCADDSVCAEGSCVNGWCRSCPAGQVLDVASRSCIETSACLSPRTAMADGTCSCGAGLIWNSTTNTCLSSGDTGGCSAPRAVIDGLCLCPGGQNFDPTTGGCVDYSIGAILGFGAAPAALGEWAGDQNYIGGGVYQGTIVNMGVPLSVDMSLSAYPEDATAIGRSVAISQTVPAAGRSLSLFTTRTELYADTTAPTSYADVAAVRSEKELARKVKAYAYLADSNGMPIGDETVTINGEAAAPQGDSPRGVYYREVNISEATFPASGTSQFALNANAGSTDSTPTPLTLRADVSGATGGLEDDWDVALDLPRRQVSGTFRVPILVNTGSNGVSSFKFKVEYDAQSFGSPRVVWHAPYLNDPLGFVVGPAGGLPLGAFSVNGIKKASDAETGNAIPILVLEFTVLDGARNAGSGRRIRGNVEEMFENISSAPHAGQAMNVRSALGDGKVIAAANDYTGLVAYVDDNYSTDYSAVDGTPAPSSPLTIFGISRMREAPWNLAEGEGGVSVSRSADGTITARMGDRESSVITHTASVSSADISVAPAGPVTLKKITGTSQYQALRPSVTWMNDDVQYDLTSRVSCTTASTNVVEIKDRCLIVPKAAGIAVVRIADGIDYNVTVTGDEEVALVGVNVVATGSIDGVSALPSTVDTSIGRAVVNATPENIFKSTAAGPVTVWANYTDGLSADITDIVVNDLRIRGESAATPASLEWVVESGVRKPQLRALRPGITYIEAPYAGGLGTGVARVMFDGAAALELTSARVDGSMEGAPLTHLMREGDPARAFHSTWTDALQLTATAAFGSGASAVRFNVTPQASFVVETVDGSGVVIEMDAATKGLVKAVVGTATGLNRVHVTVSGMTETPLEAYYYFYVTTIDELRVVVREDFDPLDSIDGRFNSFTGESVSAGTLHKVDGTEAYQTARARVEARWSHFAAGQWEDVTNNVNSRELVSLTSGGGAVALSGSVPSPFVRIIPGEVGTANLNAGIGDVSASTPIEVSSEPVQISEAAILPSAGADRTVFEDKIFTEGDAAGTIEEFEGTILGVKDQPSPVDVGVRMTDSTRFRAMMNGAQMFKGLGGDDIGNTVLFTTSAVGMPNVEPRLAATTGDNREKLVPVENGAVILTANVAGGFTDREFYAVNLVPAVGDVDIGNTIERFVPVLGSAPVTLEFRVNAGTENLKAYQFDVWYDSGVMSINSLSDITPRYSGTVGSSTNGRFIGNREEGLSTNNSDRTGKLTIIGFADRPYSNGMVPVARVTFTPNKNGVKKFTTFSGEIVAASSVNESGAETSLITSPRQPIVAGAGIVDPLTGLGDVNGSGSFTVDDIIAVQNWNLTCGAAPVGGTEAFFSSTRASACPSILDAERGFEILGGVFRFIKLNSVPMDGGMANLEITLYDADGNEVTRQAEVTATITNPSGATFNVPGIRNADGSYTAGQVDDHYVISLDNIGDGARAGMGVRLKVLDSNERNADGTPKVNADHVLVFDSVQVSDHVSCDADSDCMDERWPVCSGERCVARVGCSPSDECANAGEHCVANACRACPGDSYWDGTNCVASTGCASTADCVSGQICDTEAGVCRPLTSCALNTDCAAGLECVLGNCVDARKCANNVDCEARRASECVIATCVGGGACETNAAEVDSACGGMSDLGGSPGRCAADTGRCEIRTCSRGSECVDAYCDEGRRECVAECPPGEASCLDHTCVNDVAICNAQFCNDGNVCTTDVLNADGSCSHEEVNCSASSDGCNTGMCDQATGWCIRVAANAASVCMTVGGGEGNCAANGSCLDCAAGQVFDPRTLVCASAENCLPPSYLDGTLCCGARERVVGGICTNAGCGNGQGWNATALPIARCECLDAERRMTDGACCEIGSSFNGTSCVGIETSAVVGANVAFQNSPGWFGIPTGYTNDLGLNTGVADVMGQYIGSLAGVTSQGAGTITAQILDSNGRNNSYIQSSTTLNIAGTAASAQLIVNRSGNASDEDGAIWIDDRTLPEDVLRRRIVGYVQLFDADSRPVVDGDVRVRSLGNDITPTSVSRGLYQFVIDPPADIGEDNIMIEVIRPGVLSDTVLASLSAPVDRVSTPTLPAEAGAILLDLPANTVMSDSTIRIPLRVNTGGQRVTSFGFNIDFDGDNFECLEPELGANGARLNITTNPDKSDRLIIVGIYDGNTNGPQPEGDNAEFFRLVFRPKRAGKLNLVQNIEITELKASNDDLLAGKVGNDLIRSRYTGEDAGSINVVNAAEPVGFVARVENMELLDSSAMFGARGIPSTQVTATILRRDGNAATTPLTVVAADAVSQPAGISFASDTFTISSEVCGGGCDGMNDIVIPVHVTSIDPADLIFRYDDELSRERDVEQSDTRDYQMTKIETLWSWPSAPGAMVDVSKIGSVSCELAAESDLLEVFDDCLVRVRRLPSGWNESAGVKVAWRDGNGEIGSTTQIVTVSSEQVNLNPRLILAVPGSIQTAVSTNFSDVYTFGAVVTNAFASMNQRAPVSLWLVYNNDMYNDSVSGTNWRRAIDITRFIGQEGEATLQIDSDSSLVLNVAEVNSVGVGSTILRATYGRLETTAESSVFLGEAGELDITIDNAAPNRGTVSYEGVNIDAHAISFTAADLSSSVRGLSPQAQLKVELPFGSATRYDATRDSAHTFYTVLPSTEPQVITVDSNGLVRPIGNSPGVSVVEVRVSGLSDEDKIARIAIYVVSLSSTFVQTFEDFAPEAWDSGISATRVEDSTFSYIGGINSFERGRARVEGRWTDAFTPADLTGNDAIELAVGDPSVIDTMGGTIIEPANGIYRITPLAAGETTLTAEISDPSRAWMPGFIANEKQIIVDTNRVEVAELTTSTEPGPRNVYDRTRIDEGGEVFDGTISQVRGGTVPLRVIATMSDGTRYVVVENGVQNVRDAANSLISFGLADTPFPGQAVPTGAATVDPVSGIVTVLENGAVNLTMDVMNVVSIGFDHPVAINLLPALGDVDLGKPRGRFVPMFTGEDDFDVDVRINSAADGGMRSFDAWLSYDPRIMVCRSVTNRMGSNLNLVDSCLAPAMDPAIAGHVRINLNGQVPVAGSRPAGTDNLAATVRFTFKPGGEVNVGEFGGIIYGMSGDTGTIGTAIPAAGRAIVAGHGLVDPFGRVLGPDADFSDQSVSAILKYLARWPAFQNIDLLEADIENDGRVSPADAYRGQQVLAGLFGFVNVSARETSPNGGLVDLTARVTMARGVGTDGVSIRIPESSGLRISQAQRVMGTDFFEGEPEAGGRFVFHLEGQDGMPLSRIPITFHLERNSVTNDVNLEFSNVIVANFVCNFDDDCEDGDLCTTGTCNEGVCENAPVECRNGETCDTVSGRCRAEAGCASDNDCQASERCVERMCQDRCPAGSTWDGMTCVTVIGCQIPETDREMGACECSGGRTWANNACACPNELLWSGTECVGKTSCQPPRFDDGAGNCTCAPDTKWDEGKGECIAWTICAEGESYNMISNSCSVGGERGGTQPPVWPEVPPPPESGAAEGGAPGGGCGCTVCVEGK